jgi:hypothetical protein
MMTSDQLSRAAGSPGPALRAEVINKPIEEMRAAKEAELELLGDSPTHAQVTAACIMALAPANGRTHRARHPRAPSAPYPRTT